MSDSSTSLSSFSSSVETIDTSFPPSYSGTMKSGKHNEAHQGATISGKSNQVGAVMLFGVPIVSLIMDGKERLCLAQISSTLLKEFSYNEIHNRRVALGITCIQCTPVQLEILRRAGAMPVTSRRCGMITRREAERLCQSFLGDHAPPQLPENFSFEVFHECAWGCRGSFVPSRYNSSRAKCIRCSFCQLFFSPNKFIFHSHRLPECRYIQPDAANFNSWRRHLRLCGDQSDEIIHAWEDVKAMFNGGTRKRLLAAHCVTPSPNNSIMKQQLMNKSNPGKPNLSNTGPESIRNSSPVRRESMHNPKPLLDSANPPEKYSLITPLLSPSETSWVSGIQQPLFSPVENKPIPEIPLTIHPLSLPSWFRRPLFPFSHPMNPSCKLLEDSLINNSQNYSTRFSSAFRPVVNPRPSITEQFFTSWLSSSGGFHGAAILPEDLSVTSCLVNNNDSLPRTNNDMSNTALKIPGNGQKYEGKSNRTSLHSNFIESHTLVGDDPLRNNSAKRRKIVDVEVDIQSGSSGEESVDVESTDFEVEKKERKNEKTSRASSNVNGSAKRLSPSNKLDIDELETIEEQKDLKTSNYVYLSNNRNEIQSVIAAPCFKANKKLAYGLESKPYDQAKLFQN